MEGTREGRGGGCVEGGGAEMNISSTTDCTSEHVQDLNPLGITPKGQLHSKSLTWQLYQASDELKNDRMVVLAAIKQSCSALRYASPQMQADPEVLAAEMGPAAGLN